MDSSSALPVVLRVVVLVVVGAVIYNFFFAEAAPNRQVVFVNQELGIAGEVTGFNKARGYKIYLDSTDTPYNFDRFENAQIQPNSGLGHYLEHGDSLTKSPNSSVVVVTRNGRVSEWHFVNPPGPAQ